MVDPVAMPAGILPYGAPLSLSQAKAVMVAAEAEAVKEGWPMVIAIVDSGANLLLFQRMDQAQLGSIDVARQKAETALRFRRETKQFQDLVGSGGVHLRMLGMTNLVPMEGGIPLIVGGHIVGAIGVSGMQSGQDAQVAHAGQAALA